MIILIIVAGLVFVSSSVDAAAAPSCPFTPQGIENFNKLVLEFVDCVATEKNLDVKWWDLEASELYFDENPAHKRYAINITAENDKYTNKKSLKSVLHKKTEYAENGMTKPMKMKLHYEDTIYTSSVVGFKKGFEYGINAEASIGYPSLNLGLKGGPSAKKTRQISKESNNTKTVVVKKDLSITVPPNTKTTCVFQTEEKWVESDWTADLKIRGYIAIRLESPFNPKAIWRQCHPSYPKKVPKRNRKCHTNYKEGKKNVYFYPITNIVQNDPNFKADKDALVFKGTGRYKGPIDVSTTNVCNEEKLKGKPSKPKPRGRG